MIQIISGTNRPGAKSLEISKIVKQQFEILHEKAEILDLGQLDFSALNGSQYGENQPEFLKVVKAQLRSARGFVFVVPEYNGSMPGILKYFIDHWTYPDTFEYRPSCFIGLGGRFGGMRPVEHLQGVMGYRNAYQFPERVFISNVWNLLSDGKIIDENIFNLLLRQLENFSRFIKALESQKLDANSFLAAKKSQA
ncbi:MAG: NAD(P)H-dependent oxidoreductase [Bdellovibrionaceae bacterium]|nr:NAD(P)H-dependent oxidoreductase [Pseudobdellovibrionaceae bacterium]